MRSSLYGGRGGDTVMTKEEALDAFLKKNGIDYDRATNKQDICYDARIAELPEQLDLWLSGIASSDHDVFLELFSGYTYLTIEQCRQRYERILDLLKEQLKQIGSCLDETLFVTIENSAFASGADNVRSDLRGCDRNRVEKDQLVAAQNRLREEEIQPYKAIVFIDDIAGSGCTLWSEMKAFSERFPEIISNQNTRLYLACIIPSKKGVDHLQKNCQNFPRQIGLLYDPQWLQYPAFEKSSTSYQRLRPYEEEIDNYMRTPKDKRYFMGFGQNRLLVSFYYNTPNNTLCTFWRAIPDKLPLFIRYGNQKLNRLQIAEMRERKKQMCNQAYGFGIDRWRKAYGD